MNCLKEGANIYHQNKYGNTLLHVAIKKEYYKIIDFLLRNFPNWNYYVNRRNITAYDLSKQNSKALEIFNNFIIDLNNLNIVTDDIHNSHRLKRQRSNIDLNDIENVINEDEFSKKIRLNPGPFYDFPLHHKSGGLRHSLHGVIYQLKLHMLVMNRALTNGYNFRLATEMDDAEKFDDLVFIYENEEGDSIKYRFLQAKHKQDETIKITSNDLLTENTDGEYVISKYFTSFRKILRNNDIKGESVSFVLSTNISFDYDDLNDKGFYLLPVNEIDALLDTESMKCGLKYKFDMRNSPIKTKMYELLRCNSDLYVLAKELHNHAINNKDITLRMPIFKYYHGALINEGVLELIKEKDTSKKRASVRNYAIFNRNFINGKNLQRNTRLLRELLINFESNEQTFKVNYSTYKLTVSTNFGNVFKIDDDPQITDCKAFAEKIIDSIEKANVMDVVTLSRETGATGIVKDNLNKIAGHILIKLNEDIVINNDFLNEDTLPGNLLQLREELSKMLLAKNMNTDDIKRYKFKIYNFQTCEKENIDAKHTIPDDVIKDIEIDNFFEKLIFAVNQPNEIELEEIIKREIKRDVKFNMLNVDLITDSFQKELLDWLKEKGCIKGKEGRFLSTENARKLFVDIDEKINTIIGIGLSLNYPKQLASFNINFNVINQQICDFLETKHVQILIIECDNVLLTSLKINQLLDERPYKLDSIIFTNIEMTIKLKDYIIKAFKSVKSHNLLVISCDLSEGYTKIFNLYIDLLPIINDNKEKKLILLTNLNERINIKSDNTLLINDKYNFNDFSLETIKLLENKLVLYQGNDIKLGTITENLKYVLDIDTLIKLINNVKITIGKQLIGLREVADYYVERKFSYHPSTILNYLDAIIILSGINNEILESLNVKKDILTYKTAIEIGNIKENVIILIDDDNDDGNEIEAKLIELSNLINTECSNKVYWFKYDLNKLILQRNKYFDTLKPSSLTSQSNSYEYLIESYKTFTEIEMLNKEGIIILSNLAGMGKSTCTICLSNKLKYTNHSIWVIRINLNGCTDTLEDELYYRSKNLSRFKSNDKNSAINFLINHLIPNEFETLFEKRLFELLINEDKKVAIYFDGYDEISPNYDSIIIDLIEQLRMTKIKIIFITTRPTSEYILQEKFHSIPYNLEILTTEEQIAFVKRKWSNTLRKLGHSVNGKIINNYVNFLIMHITNTINDKDKKLTGIPLISFMIADVYFDKFLICYKNVHHDTDWNQFDQFDIVELYEKFIYNKFLIYNSEKKIERSSNLSVKYDNETLYKEYLRKHQYAALYTLLKKSELYSLLAEEQRKDMLAFINNIKSGIERTGIITQIIDNKPIFFHTTFTEFFAALFLIEQLQSDWKDVEMLLIKIFVQPEYEVMRLFFNGLLRKDENVKLNISNMWDQKIVTQLNDKDENLLHVACKESNEGVIKFLLEVIKESTLNKLLNVRVRKGKTCLIYAIRANNVSIVNMILEHGANPNECDYNGFTPLHISTRSNYLDIVKLLLKYNANKFMKNHKDRMPIFYAAKYGHIDSVKLLASKESNSITDGDYQHTLPIDIAARHEHWNIVEWFIENVNYDSQYCTLSKSNVLNYAAKFGKIDIIKTLLDKFYDIYFKQIKFAIRDACCNNQLTVTKLLLSFIEPPYEYGETYLSVSSINGHIEIVEYLLSLNIRIKFEDNWLDADDIFHNLIYNDRLDILKILLSDEANLNETDSYGLTIALTAADKEKWTILNWLLNEKCIDVNKKDIYSEWTLLHYSIATKNVNTDTIKMLLRNGATLDLAKSKTALDLAVEYDHKNIIVLLKEHFDIT